VADDVLIQSSLSDRQDFRKDQIHMKRVFLTLSVVLFAALSFAQTTTVLRWQQIVGNITAPGVDNPVAGIAAGGFPWTTTAGTATVNVSTGATTFQVQGLVLNGSNASGTPGAVQTVMGTLVCGAGTATQAIFDTPTVPLSPQGDAQFSGTLAMLPSPCVTPLFLIRSGPAATARWLATGAVFTTITQ
jgi:hypothetical protein